MRGLKRISVDAPCMPTFEDVHPHSTWSMCVRVYHKFHVERFAVGRKRLNMVLLDEKVMLAHLTSAIVNTIITSAALSQSFLLNSE
jgi:hypothetical protein